MGTTYSVILKSDTASPEAVYEDIETELKDINQLMSTYIPDSEINRFNSLKDDSCFHFSDKSWEVLVAAQKVYHATNGAFDITMGPLISRWGFNVEEYDEKVPTSVEVNSLLAKVGTNKLNYDFTNQCISKRLPEITINLSAIAKGYGVDRVAHIVEQHGVFDYLVEIGGETKAKGRNPSSTVWRVAVENPSSLSQREMLVVGLTDTSIATSGDYRNYYTVDGKRFSHTIDPETGYPVEHTLSSVSVIHSQNMYADAYATAFSVMGVERSLELANRLDLPVFIVEHSNKQDEEANTHSNDQFGSYILTH
ncbi:FAD:protein FMN transferase [Kangiella japonica]|uniref:FAD:protein FMN transferase n=2 Tax=Kangiella japonica TaxID=647384 RepID=A0ABN0SY87_9GAMM